VSSRLNFKFQTVCKTAKLKSLCLIKLHAMKTYGEVEV